MKTNEKRVIFVKRNEKNYYFFIYLDDKTSSLESQRFNNSRHRAIFSRFQVIKPLNDLTSFPTMLRYELIKGSE